jgi:hypothetical protein
MEQLAWSDGSKPLRSLKEDRMKYLGAVDSNDFQDAKVSHDNKNVSGRCSRYNDVMGDTIFREPNTKREEANEKINERDMVGQTCQNPFFNNTKYINVIDVQENFLMPRSSNDKDNCSKNM